MRTSYSCVYFYYCRMRKIWSKILFAFYFSQTSNDDISLSNWIKMLYRLEIRKIYFQDTMNFNHKVENCFQSISIVWKIIRQVAIQKCEMTFFSNQTLSTRVSFLSFKFRSRNLSSRLMRLSCLRLVWWWL